MGFLAQHLEDLQKHQGIRNSESTAEVAGGGGVEEPAESLHQAIADLENINAHLFSIEALMERIFDVKVPEEVERKFREIAGELAPDPLNIDRLILNRLFHQAPDSPDKKTNSN